MLKAVGLRSAWSSIDGLKFDPAYGIGETDVEGLTKLPDDTVYWYIANDADGGDPYTSSLKTTASGRRCRSWRRAPCTASPTASGCSAGRRR